MKIAYLDTIGGIAGDMTLAAFVSAGLPLDDLVRELRKLPLEGFELIGRHVQRSDIDAVHIDVVVSQESHHHRHLRDIHSIIEASALSSGIKEKAKAVFSTIAVAEAKIHDTTPDRVHFHEVGAIDSIVDIVGTAICLEVFGIEQLYTSPIKLGSGGMINSQHGKIPVPTPATLEILKDYPTILTGIPHELTTPTGAGIVKALSGGTLDEDQLRIQAIGYGAGTRDFPELPNLLRVMIGELVPSMGRDRIAIVETNIDDMNPQVFPYLMEKLLASGALDAYLVPVIMKKGRPGYLLSVLTDRSKLDDIVGLIYSQTTTIGIRIHDLDRRKLSRQQREIQTSFGLVKVKMIRKGNTEVLVPEYEECRRIADEKQIPLLDIMRMLEHELVHSMSSPQ